MGVLPSLARLAGAKAKTAKTIKVEERTAVEEEALTYANVPAVTAAETAELARLELEATAVRDAAKARLPALREEVRRSDATPPSHVAPI